MFIINYKNTINQINIYKHYGIQRERQQFSMRKHW